MFVVKKIVALFFYPVGLCLGILILGLFCLWATRRQRLGKVLVTLGTVLLLLLSTSFISSGLLVPLEHRYPALLHPETVSWGPNRFDLSQMDCGAGGRSRVGPPPPG